MYISACMTAESLRILVILSFYRSACAGISSFGDSKNSNILAGPLSFINSLIALNCSISLLSSAYCPDKW